MTALFMVAVLAAGTTACAGPSATAPRKLNVLVCVLDAVRGDRMGFAGYGRPTTPGLDALAQEGVWFADAFAAASWTKPSIGALWTSRYPSELGLLDSNFTSGTAATLDPRLPTLAQGFSRAGWATLAVINQVHLSAANGFAGGFDPFLHFEGRDALFLNRELLAALGQVGERPFFAYVHYLDAHWPYESMPKRLRREFGKSRFAVEPPHGLEAVLSWKAQSLDEKALASLESRYDAEIRVLDDRLSMLFAELRRRGQWDDTLVVVTADHGEGFDEHGVLMHGDLPYVEQARVPLLFHPPAGSSWPRGRRETPVSLVDLAPTLLELAGLAPLAGGRGRSLRALLERDRAADNLVLTQGEGAWALRSRAETLLGFDDGRLERFDRLADPRELSALAWSAARDRFAPLESRLQQLRSLLVRTAGSGKERKLTAEETATLRALGYL